ncbi:hypothetical protein NQ315_012883 [Exocentrus adspersus]|uniref:Phospholipase A2-like domain-containing protein n=1 Tax=Exocentrus adspersus TaxID=1586481 RepID=A0AAV8VH11_9CUCU|nr:hypothetical protein NQ315_012883 [Exocentrus adspersus]
MLIKKQGSGVVNSLISKLPIELHLPTYQYCGPGTKLQKRLARGDPGINKLDQSCRQHDIAYSKSSNLQDRHKAGHDLKQQAWQRVNSKHASFGEKAAAWVVTSAMKVKRKLGMGIDDGNNNNNNNDISNVKKVLLQNQPQTGDKDLRKNATVALKAARFSMKQIGGNKNINVPRVLPLPKSGGILPLLPLLADLGAIGSLTGGAAAVAKTALDAKNAQNRLEEAKRHNEKMEAIALGKQGSGLYLKRQKNYQGSYPREHLIISSWRNMQRF